MQRQYGCIELTEEEVATIELAFEQRTTVLVSTQPAQRISIQKNFFIIPAWTVGMVEAGQYEEVQDLASAIVAVMKDKL